MCCCVKCGWQLAGPPAASSHKWSVSMGWMLSFCIAATALVDSTPVEFVVQCGWLRLELDAMDPPGGTWALYFARPPHIRKGDDPPYTHCSLLFIYKFFLLTWKYLGNPTVLFFGSLVEKILVLSSFDYIIHHKTVGMVRLYRSTQQTSWNKE